MPTTPLPGTLDDAHAQIVALRAQLRQFAAGIVWVDGDGVVTAHADWSWPNPPAVGQPFADGFDEPARADVRALAERAWLGASEHRFRLAVGRTVYLSVEKIGQGYQIVVQDVTMRDALDVASEERRRMHALAEFAASLARELTDPMSIVQGRLELLLDLGVSEAQSVLRHLGIALDHARRVTATLHNLRLVGRTADTGWEPVRADEAVREALVLVGPRRDQVLVSIDPADLCFACDAALAARVLASLVRQSLEAVGRGPIHLKAKKDRGQVTVRIGPRGRLTGDPVDGEELALDRTLLASVGGTIDGYRSGALLRFDVVLQQAVSPRSRKRTPRGRVAVVGASICDALPAMLDRDGYDFVTASTAAEGLALLDGTEVDALIVELLLEGVTSGLALADAIGRRPSAPRLIVVHQGPIPTLPAPIVALKWPAGRSEVLEVLGERIRR